jgi:lipopolysaccharide transport system permease protein
LFVALVIRDLKVQYSRAFLGLGWALATPVMQLVIFSQVFHRALATDIANYPSFVFIGVLAWGWFQSALFQSTTLITGSKPLVRQPGFPVALLPHVTVAVRLIHFLLGLPVLLALLLWTGARPTASWSLIPALIVLQYLLTVGLAYPLASISVVVRDAPHMIGVVLQLLMFLTPVFYDLAIVPDDLRPWFWLNPMVTLVTAWRTVVLDGAWPDLRPLAILLAVAGLLHAAGKHLFVSQSHRFVEEI